MVAVVELVERIGSAPSMDIATTVLNLQTTDDYSTPTSYLEHALPARTDNGPVYSMERWCRLRFSGDFGSVQQGRFWVAGWSNPPGWTVRWGTTLDFDTPTNSVSSYALSPLPTSDPGENSPNIMGSGSLLGTETQYSFWVVLQAVATGDAATGPISGFELDGDPVSIPYRFAWTEN